jgi:hypothetical protein
MINNTTHLAEINSPNQKIKASVELYRGFTLETTCTCDDVLSSFSVERVGEGKFFGFGIVHTLKVNLIDVNRALTVDSGNFIELAFIVNNTKVYPYPPFYIKPEDIERDETTNTITITAYDLLGKAAEHTFNELNLVQPYTYLDVILACKNTLGIAGSLIRYPTDFQTSFNNGANFEGTENLRDVLNAVAEATQSIYFARPSGRKYTGICFSAIKETASVNYPISRDKYYTLKTNGTKVLGNICHATDLGNNVASTTGIEGITQYVRDNPFWESIDDIGATVDAAAAKICGSSIAQFECEWAGNYLLEPVDKITLEAEDGSLITTYILDDVIYYDGTLSETTKWQYNENDTETFNNPSNLGDALKQTFARVDKVNKQIDLVVSDTNANRDAISTLQMNTDSIRASVSSLEKATNQTIGAMNENFETLSKQVSAKMSAEDVQLAIETELINGVNEVKTTTGFTFNKDGLKVSKSGSEMTTLITEDGMKISRSGQETLVADNTGVKAENLHSVTFLIIGSKSRLEDYGSSRTGCFWIGG